MQPRWANFNSRIILRIMCRYEERKVRRSEIAATLANSKSCTELTTRALNMPKHLLGTFCMDIEMFIVTSSEDITYGGDINFFLENGWFREFNMRKVYHLLKKASMI